MNDRMKEFVLNIAMALGCCVFNSMRIELFPTFVASSSHIDVDQ